MGSYDEHARQGRCEQTFSLIIKSAELMSDMRPQYEGESVGAARLSQAFRPSEIYACDICFGAGD